MRESLGFRIVIFASILYIIGLIVSVAVDIKPRREIMLRLMKDLRNIDRYGLREGTADGPEYLDVQEAFKKKKKKKKKRTISPKNKDENIQQSTSMNTLMNNENMQTVVEKQNAHFEGGESDEEQKKDGDIQQPQQYPD